MASKKLLCFVLTYLYFTTIICKATLQEPLCRSWATFFPHLHAVSQFSHVCVNSEVHIYQQVKTSIFTRLGRYDRFSVKFPPRIFTAFSGRRVGSSYCFSFSSFVTRCWITCSLSLILDVVTVYPQSDYHLFSFGYPSSLMYPSLTVQTVQTCYSYPNIPAAIGFQLSPQPLSPTLIPGSLSPPIQRRAMSPGPQCETSLVRRSMSPLPHYERITSIKSPPYLYRQDSHFRRKIQER